MKPYTSRTRFLCICLLAVCVLAFVTVAFSSVVTVDHVCAGEHCAVCFSISMQKQILDMCLLLLAVCVLVCGARALYTLSRLLAPVPLSYRTPVCLKVKLSN